MESLVPLSAQPLRETGRMLGFIRNATRYFTPKEGPLDEYLADA